MFANIIVPVMGVKLGLSFFFSVLLTVHLIIIPVINQINAQNDVL